MAKWWNNIRKAKESKNGKRFLTSFDMAEAKRMESILNSRVKRGEKEKGNVQHMTVCSCGNTGCIIVSSRTEINYNKTGV